MLRKIALAALLSSTLGMAHAAPAGGGIGRVPVVGPLVQGLLPGGTAFIPVLGIPIPAVSTELLLPILNPLLTGLSQPAIRFGGGLINTAVSPVLGLLDGTAARNARSLGQG